MQGSEFPDQGLNPCPLQWKHGVNHWTPGKSLFSHWICSFGINHENTAIVKRNRLWLAWILLFPETICGFYLCWTFGSFMCVISPGEGTFHHDRWKSLFQIEEGYVENELLCESYRLRVSVHQLGLSYWRTVSQEVSREDSTQMSEGLVLSITCEMWSLCTLSYPALESLPLAFSPYTHHLLMHYMWACVCVFPY